MAASSGTWPDRTSLYRNERRGLGGIFFDDLNDRDPDALLAFSKDCQAAVVESYLPIVMRHKDDPYTPEQKEWQQMRRGRYVEFNLVSSAFHVLELHWQEGREYSVHRSGTTLSDVLLLHLALERCAAHVL